MSNFHDDAPIEHPDHDELEHGVFAKALADCILDIENPKGSVIAVHGSWGSGKSSVINLVLHELDGSHNRPAIIPFNSWCYRSEEGIVSGFFQEFYSGLKSEIRDSTIDLEPLMKLGARLTSIAKLAGPVLDNTVPGVSKVVSAGNDFFERSMLENQTIDSLQRRISKELYVADKRFLVVIDDIDRLSPEEAIAIFRIIKSVGRLSNVIYLVAYDRIATEKMIKKLYPSEGNSYLEKIVQASFDLPDPRSATLIGMFEARLNKIFETTISDRFQASDDRIENIVVPQMQTPRDVHRLANILSVTYPAVEMDVDIEDFVSLETIRLFHPDIYREIRLLKNTLTKVRSNSEERMNLVRRKVKKACKKSDSDFDTVFGGIVKLFPTLGINSNSAPSIERVNRWHQERRLCSRFHFDTYFRFSVSGDIVSSAEFQEFIGNASLRSYVESKLNQDKNPETAYDQEKISFLLDKIHFNDDAINSRDIEPLLLMLYEMIDSFSISNGGRVLSLSKKLLTNRIKDMDTSTAILAICKVAPLKYLMDLCGWANDYFQKDIDKELDEEKYLVTKRDMMSIREVTLQKIRNAAENDTLLRSWNTFLIIRLWNDISDSDGEVSRVFSEMIGRDNDNAITAALDLSKLFSPDFVDDSRARLRVEIIGKIIDIDEFASKLLHIVESENIDRDKKDTVRSLAVILNTHRPESTE